MPIRESRSPGFRLALTALAGLLAVIVLAGVAVLRYAAPNERLDWSSAVPPSIRDKVEEMILERKLSILLTESEVDALIKQHWGGSIAINDYAEVAGARFELEGNRLLAHTRVTIAGMADVALDHVFRLEWQEPDIVITHISSSVKDFELPPSWIRLGQIRIPLSLDDRMPVAVKSVEFAGDGVVIQMRLKVPNLFE